MEQLPRHVFLAVVAAEDGDFFKHAGLDFWGILRAAYANFKAGKVVQGGSTITQQVARGLLLSPQRTIVRKLKEAILAYRIEQYLTKEEILYLYLNQIYLGAGAYGVQAAAQTYFAKDAKDLTVAEAAFLAGLVKAPSRYHPVKNFRRARSRQEYVLGRLLEDGHLTPRQAEEALNQPLDLKLVRPATVEAAYYSEHVRQWLEERFGPTQLYEGGLTVYTACDPEWSREGQAAIDLGLKELTERQGYRGPHGTVSATELEAAGKRPLQASGLEAGQVVSAVVIKVGEGGKGARVRMGSEGGDLDERDLAWARRAGKPLQSGQQVLVRLAARDGKTAGLWRVELYQEPKAQAALLAIEGDTGRVRAMIGGRDFEHSQFNRAIQARRQPGSAFKPFIYAAALDHPVQGWTPASQIVDAPVVYDDVSLPGQKWKPKNFENRFFGTTSLRTALEHSRNVVTVKILAQLGLDTPSPIHGATAGERASALSLPGLGLLKPDPLGADPGLLGSSSTGPWWSRSGGGRWWNATALSLRGLGRAAPVGQSCDAFLMTTSWGGVIEKRHRPGCWPKSPWAARPAPPECATLLWASPPDWSAGSGWARTTTCPWAAGRPAPRPPAPSGRSS